MARLNGSPVRQFRGTTAQHANYTGPSGELTVDTSKNAVVVQDGATKGGHPAAVDAKVVHNTGDESISGFKTFKDFVVLRGDTVPKMVMAVSDTLEKGVAPAATQGTALVLHDKTVNVENPSDASALAICNLVYRPDQTAAYLGVYAPEKGSTKAMSVGIVYPDDGQPFGYAPTPADDVTANEIITAEWVKKNISVGKVYVAGDGLSLTDDTFAVDDTVVRLAGEQIITGNKIYRSSGTKVQHRLQLAGITKGTNPAAQYIGEMVVFDNTGITEHISAVGAFGLEVQTNGDVVAYMNAYRWITNAQAKMGMSVVYPKTDIPYAIAPTPKADAASNEIVTAEWVKANAQFADLPLYFTIDTTGATQPVIHTVFPSYVTTAQMTTWQANGSGTQNLACYVDFEFETSSPVLMQVESAVDVSKFAGKSVKIYLDGINTQTIVAGLLHLV